MTHLSLRFQLAIRLAGQGSLQRFCAIHDCDRSNVIHGAAGRRGLPDRLRKAMEAFIREEFERNASVLDLEACP